MFIAVPGLGPDFQAQEHSEWAARMEVEARAHPMPLPAVVRAPRARLKVAVAVMMFRMVKFDRAIRYTVPSIKGLDAALLKLSKVGRP